MKKEEILQMSRKENKQKDLALIEEENKAVKLSALSILILATIYYVCGIIITGNTNYGWYSIISLYCAIFYGYRGIKTNRKQDILISIIWILVTIITTYSYISNLISSSTIL